MKDVHLYTTHRTRPPKEVVFFLVLVLFLICSTTIAFAADLTPDDKARLERELFHAVWDNRPGEVARIIDEGIDPNTRIPLRNNAYRTLLYDATYKGFGDVVKVLLDKGADPNSQNSNGKTALHLAAQRGVIKIVKMLLAAKADPNIKAEDGSTPLINTAFDGHTDAAALLINAGAAVNVQTSRTGRTALHIAAKNGYTELVKLLLDHGATPNTQDADHRTAMGLAAMNDNVPAADALLSHGADTDAGERPPLFYAAREGHADMVRLLIKHKAAVNQADEEGETALMEAARGGHVDTGRLLLEHGADPSLADSLGRTALHLAANGETVELLLANKAAVDPRNKEGDTPLFLAARHAESVQCLKCDEKAEVLVKHKADLLAVNDDGEGIIHAAAEGGLEWLVEQCLQAGADINARDKAGRTPLHHAVAAQRPSQELIRYLIDKGADVNALDNSGKSPLDLATELPRVKGHEIIEVLVSHGAQTSMTLKPPPP